VKGVDVCVCVCVRVGVCVCETMVFTHTHIYIYIYIHTHTHTHTHTTRNSLAVSVPAAAEELWTLISTLADDCGRVRAPTLRLRAVTGLLVRCCHLVRGELEQQLQGQTDLSVLVSVAASVGHLHTLIAALHDEPLFATQTHHSTCAYVRAAEDASGSTEGSYSSARTWVMCDCYTKPRSPGGAAVLVHTLRAWAHLFAHALDSIAQSVCDPWIAAVHAAATDRNLARGETDSSVSAESAPGSDQSLSRECARRLALFVKDLELLARHAAPTVLDALSQHVAERLLAALATSTIDVNASFIPAEALQGTGRALTLLPRTHTAIARCEVAVFVGACMYACIVWVDRHLSISCLHAWSAPSRKAIPSHVCVRVCACVCVSCCLLHFTPLAPRVRSQPHWEESPRLRFEFGTYFLVFLPTNSFAGRLFELAARHRPQHPLSAGNH
jgi:hypothetical protein